MSSVYCIPFGKSKAITGKHPQQDHKIIQRMELQKIDFFFKKSYLDATNTAQKMKFSIKDFFSKCDRIPSFLQIWSRLLKKFLMKTSFFVQCKWYEKLFHILIRRSGGLRVYSSLQDSKWLPTLKYSKISESSYINACIIYIFRIQWHLKNVSAIFFAFTSFLRWQKPKLTDTRPFSVFSLHICVNNEHKIVERLLYALLVSNCTPNIFYFVYLSRLSSKFHSF